MALDRLVSIDPGEHTGLAFWDRGHYLFGEMVLLDGFVWSDVFRQIEKFCPKVLVMEDFRLYPWKAKEQSWSQLKTPQLIGVIKYWAFQHRIPLVLQPASIKTNYPDAYLTKLSNSATIIHVRDSIRHGLYYLEKNGSTISQQ